ncbi:capsule biosynthesis protein CapA-like isoform X1 [Porites lutea]|uniref:capsule biosynthesis protein CapA-like isoform X1 n=2 Tax=Porites lutea TaxID=51062 RepID=UPI003CC50640
MKTAVVFLYFMKIILCTADDQVSLLFVGDVSFSAPVKYYVEHGYHTYNDSFNEVAPYIRNADISVANLESPFVSADMYRYKFKGEKVVVLDASPDAAAALRFAGFDAVTLANNHLNDFGVKGANFTVEVLKKTGVKYFGVSHGQYDNSQEPLILEAKGIKIGFLGYCDSPSYKQNCTQIRKLYNAGPAIYSDVIAARDVNNLRKAKVDIIVVLIHFGHEHYRRTLPYQFRTTKHLMSLGVQVIIGAHPHVIQQHCLHDNKLVAYSLGNFLFHPTRPISVSRPAVYGRLGKKPNKDLIDSFEHFVLGSSENLKKTQMLKVTLSRNGVLRASYLPLKILFDSKSKRIHPEPIKNARWIRVCGKKDKQCEKSCKDPRRNNK